MSMRRLLPLLVLAGTFFILCSNTQQASAVTAAEWQAGRIIDDSVFTDKNSMTVVEIQNFLNSKVPICDTNGTRGGSFNRAAYGTERGNPPPFTCLKDYFEVPKLQPGPGEPANNYGNTAIPPGAKSAAHLIWDAAQAYNISPKVLLVTLQKEQGLITDDWPFKNQFMKAMGANCPDSPTGAACDSDYSGFSLQMRQGAALFRSYLDNMTQPWWPYKKPYQVNSILWQNVHTRDCGSGNVHIQTMATAALYTYTPYQPNQAALNNMYGTGDECSAYGNRNFWRTFHDWFYSTYGNLFQASLLSQSPGPSMPQGQSRDVTLRYRNSGLWTWHDDAVHWPGIPPVHLATTNHTKHPSIFSYGWPNNNTSNTTFSKVYEANGTTLASNQHVVNPGQIAEFTFPVTVPWSAATGNYTEFFKPFISHDIDMGNAATARVDIDVPPNFRASIVTQSIYPIMRPGETKTIMTQYKNTGAWAWHDDTVNWPGIPPVYLSTANGNNFSVFSYAWPTRSIATKTFNKVYEADGTTLASNQHVAHPGQIVEFQITLAAPWSLGIGMYTEFFKPVLFGTGHVLTGPTSFGISIPPWHAEYVSQAPPMSLPRGSAAWTWVRYRNAGAWSWHDDKVNWPNVPPVSLVTANVNNTSIFSYNWPSSRVATSTFGAVYEADGTTLASNQHVAHPGQIVSFAYILTTPWGASQQTTYKEYFKPSLLNSGIQMSLPSSTTEVNVYVP